MMRPFISADAGALFRILGDPEVMRFSVGGADQSVADTSTGLNTRFGISRCTGSPCGPFCAGAASTSSGNAAWGFCRTAGSRSATGCAGTTVIAAAHVGVVPLLLQRLIDYGTPQAICAGERFRARRGSAA